MAKMFFPEVFETMADKIDELVDRVNDLMEAEDES